MWQCRRLLERHRGRSRRPAGRRQRRRGRGGAAWSARRKWRAKPGSVAFWATTVGRSR